MLKLINYIKDNPLDWEEKLKSDPYNLIIKRKENFILFYYNQISSDFKEEIVRESRGIILEDNTWKVLAYPFKKFSNIQEGHADKVDFKTAKCLEKIDGSLIKIWFYKGELKVSSMSEIDAREARLLPEFSEIFENFYELFMSEAKKEVDFEKLDKDNTYIFELTSPYNRVVVPHSKVEIYHTGTRNNLTLKEHYEDIGVKKPKEYSFSSIEEVMQMASKLPFNEEGYVVVDGNFNRVKIKSPAYVAVHHLNYKGTTSVPRMLILIVSKEHEEFLSYFPEYKEAFDKVAGKYDELLKEIKSNLIDAEFKKDLSRKDFALWATKTIIPSILFNYLDNKVNIDNYEKYIRDVSPEKLQKILKL